MTLLIILISIFLPPIQVDKDQEELVISIKDLPHFEDPSRNYSYEEISSPSFDGFIVNNHFQPIDYNVNAAYWVKFSLKIPEGKDYLLEFFDQSIDSIEVNMVNPGGEYQRVNFGDALLFNDKEFNHKNFQVLLDDPGKYEFYIRVASYQYADIRMAIRSFDYFVSYAVYEYFLYGIFYGMILIISLYNLLMYGAVKEIKYLYYTFYILSIGLYAMCVDGIAYQFLWPSAPEWNQIAYGVALFLVIFWSIIFSKKFLNLKVRAPKVDRMLNIILAARIVIFLYALLFNNSFFQYRSIELIPLSVIFYGSIMVFVRGYKPARFFVLAYGFLFLGFIFKALLMLAVAPPSPKSYYVLHVCFILEMLFLSFALSDRVRILKNNRDRVLKRTIAQHEVNMKLKDKVNAELERKVAERTRLLKEKNTELEETNQKLNNQAEEINRINSLLGRDNWKLKRNLREVLQDRLFNKDLSYSEFNKIFPDEISCHKFLDKLKWGKGYYCQKCDNKKFSDGKTKYGRRCTKCGYEESITSHTVFHRLKFPIEKAFYILYLINNQSSEHTLDELSAILNLRRNTIWSFKKKNEKIVNDKDYQKMVIHHQDFFMK